MSASVDSMAGGTVAPVQGERPFKRALIFTPHPDDAEVMAGATMAKWAAQGTEIIVCVVTNGAMGSNDPAVERDDLIATRRREQQEAAALLGVSEIVFLDYEDGYVEDSHDLRRDMIREIRRHQPDVVVGPDPALFYAGQQYVNHPDHRAVGLAFCAAVNPGATTVPLYRTDLFDRGFAPHQVQACLLGLTMNVDYVVDIAEFIDVKIASLKAHASQMADWEGMEDFVRSMAALIGQTTGGAVPLAEGFKAFFFGDQ
ncbi:MAG: PIG-L family deacetylase [Actinomycetota bacterium]